MPRYFFNVVNDVRTQDFEGIELADLDAAKVEAQNDIDEIRRTHFSSLSGDWSSWSIEIADQDGALLFIVPFLNN